MSWAGPALVVLALLLARRGMQQARGRTHWAARPGATFGPNTSAYLDNVAAEAAAAGLPVLVATSGLRSDAQQVRAMAANMARHANGPAGYLLEVHPRVPERWRVRMAAAYPNAAAMEAVLSTARMDGVNFSVHNADNAVDVATAGLTPDQISTLTAIMQRHARRAFYHDAHIHAQDFQ